MKKNRIGELREGLGLSLTDLARRVKTTPAQIQKLERGERRLSLEWMKRLARAMGVKMSAFLPADEVECEHEHSRTQLDGLLEQFPRADRMAVAAIVMEFASLLRRYNEQTGQHGAGSRANKKAVPSENVQEYARDLIRIARDLSTSLETEGFDKTARSSKKRHQH